MKLPNKVNPMHCASTDKTRPMLKGVKIQGNLAIATDGRCMCVALGTRAEGNELQDCVIPTRAAKLAWPQGQRGKCVLPVLSSSKNHKGAVTILDENFDYHDIGVMDVKYPKVTNAIDGLFDHKISVSFDVNILLKIVKSLGTKKITLHFNEAIMEKALKEESGYPNPIFVSSTNSTENDCFGVIMPLTSPSYPCLANNNAIKEFQKLKDLDKEND